MLGHPGRTNWRIVAIGLAVVLAVPACSASSDDEGAPRRPEGTPWERELANVSADGTRSLESALRLFAIAFGPLPGVDAPSGRHELIDASIAVAEVRAHESELTPRQRQAVEEALRTPPDAVTCTISPEGEVSCEDAASAGAGRSRPSLVPPPPKAVETYGGLFATAREQISDKLGWNFPGFFAFTVGWAGGNYAETGGRWNDAGFIGCHTMFDSKKNPTGKEVLNTIFHEMVHCFQQSTHSSAAAADAAYMNASWAWEGSAEWISTTLTAPDRSTPGRWLKYLTQPTRPLFARFDDAIGFFAHLEQSGTNPWSVFQAMWVASSSGAEAAYQASGAGERFLDSWASGYFRGEVPGEDWNMTGPGITNRKPRPVPVNIEREDSEGQPFDVEPYTNSVYRLRAAADVVEVTVEPGSHVRVSDGSTDTVVVGVDQFCTRPGGCACPGGAGTEAPPTPLKRTSALAITGGPGGTKATITGFSVKNLCCAEPVDPTTVEGLTITPSVSCRTIGLYIDSGGDLRFHIAYGLRVDHPHLVPQVTRKNGKATVTGVELQGITGMILAFDAGVASTAANKSFDIDIPLEVEVPVRPAVRGLPRSMVVSWAIHIETVILGDNSTIKARGEYGLAGPFAIRNGSARGPTPTLVGGSLIDSIGGIVLAPSGIIIDVTTRFAAKAGTPPAMKGAFAALEASFGVGNGSALGAPFARCHGASINLFLGGGRAGAGTAGRVFQGADIVPDDPVCDDTLDI